MRKHEIEQMHIWTEILKRSNELFAMAETEQNPAKAQLIRKRAHNLSNEFGAHGSTRKRKEMTEEQLFDSICYAKKLLGEYR